MVGIFCCLGHFESYRGIYDTISNCTAGKLYTIIMYSSVARLGDFFFALMIFVKTEEKSTIFESRKFEKIIII